MRTAHIWNQHHLFGKKISILVLMFLAISQFASAQRVVNLPNYEDKTTRWGFQLAGHGFMMNPKYSSQLISGGETRTVTSGWTQGFSAHFVLQKALEDELWAFRVTPGIALYERALEKVVYDASGAIIEVDNPAPIQSATIEVPLLLKYRSLRRRNFRMYMIGGVVPSLISGLKESAFVKNYNFEVTYGFGFDFYWQFFKFAPEIRFSHGLVNVYQPSLELPELQRLTTHRVSLYLNFE